MLWSTINSEITVLTNDQEGTAFSSPLRIACFNRAMQFFAASHTAPVSASSLGSVNEGTNLAIPSNYVDFGGILSNDGWLLQQYFEPGGVYPTTGFLNMGNAIKIFENLVDGEFWYYRAYASVVDSNSQIELPAWAEWPVLNLTMAYLMNPTMIDQARLRQFQTNRESGQPEDNPPRKQAEFYFKKYNEMLVLIPPQLRGLYRK